MEGVGGLESHHRRQIMQAALFMKPLSPQPLAFRIEPAMRVGPWLSHGYMEIGAVPD
jgi:hypothetical protein